MFLYRVKTIFSMSVKLSRVFFQTMYGAWRLSKLPQPIISIFGGSRIPQHDKYALQANQLARMLAEQDTSVITGGGAGIMEAASCGAVRSPRGKGKIVGIGVTGLGELHNPCVEEYLELDYFFARKYLLTRFSTGFVIFPGGFGTLDEFAEILTLIQTQMMRSIPVVFIGKEYWAPFMLWLNDQALRHGLLAKEDIQLFSMTDDTFEAFCFIRGECKIL